MKFSARPLGGWTLPAFIPNPRQVKLFKPRQVNFRTLERAFRSWRIPDSTLAGGPRKDALKKQEEELGTLWEAFRFMRYVHGYHVRADGTVLPTQLRKVKRFGFLPTQYEEHPFNAALYAAQSGCDLRTVIAAMLHDCVEDRQVRVEEIRDRFGSDIATMVSKLSTPRLVTADTPDAQLERVKINVDGKELFKEIHVVYPESRYYHEEVIKKQEKNLFQDRLNREAIIQFQANRIYGPAEGDFTAQDFNTILVKQFEGLHNLQTMEYLPADALLKRVSKSVSYAMFSFDRLNPAFMRSVPRRVKDVLLRLDPHFKAHFPQPGGVHHWYARLGPRRWLNRRRLLAIPAATDDRVNVHEVADPAQERLTLHHTFEVGFPFSMVGGGQAVSEGLYAELKRQFSAHFGDVVRIEKTSSLLPPGLAIFHFFKVDLSRLQTPKDGNHFNRYLKPALAQTLARFHIDPLMDLGASKRDRMLRPLLNNAYYAQFPGNSHHVALFLPHVHYGGPAARDEIGRIIGEFQQTQPGNLLNVAADAAHPCATFHSFELNFKPGRKADRVNNSLKDLVAFLDQERDRFAVSRRGSISTRAGYAVRWMADQVKKKLGRGR
ncbi:HD domain-containing protein [Candidatus Micrarchaeota archaeon]|nr:HD domain-containing protein [Candidatus Micrarchaeota archaeon]